MKWTLFTLILTGLSLSISANEDLEMLVTLAEDSRDIVVELEDPQDQFVLDEESSDFIYSLQLLDNEIAAIVPDSVHDPNEENKGPGDPAKNKPCADQYAMDQAIADRIKGRKFQLYFTATFSEGAELGLNPGFSGKNNYRAFMTSESQNGHPDAFQIRTIKELENRYKRESQPRQWGNLSLLERAQRLQEFAKEYSGAEPSLGLILSEYAIADMTANPSGWKDSLNEIKDHLTFDEKLKVASHFGGRFSDNYNYDRADGKGPRAGGIVTIEEMLESVRDSTPGGVCRDVSQAQSLMLQQMGVSSDSIYQVAYRTVSGGHVVLAVKDPDDPKRIVKINYDYTDETSDRSGGSVLTQNSSLPEFGMQYRIYDAAGKPVATVPTEMGQVLKDVTRQRELSDGLSRQHNLQRVYMDTPYGVGSVFTGTTTSGDNLVGVAFSHQGDKDKFLSTDFGVAAVKRDGERSMVSVSESALFGYAKATLRSPRLERGNFSLGVNGGASSEVIISDNTATYSWGTEKSGTNMDVRTGVFAGADVKYESDDGKTRAASSVTVEGFINHKDEQRGPESGYMLAPDSLVWNTSVEHDISRDMIIAGETAVVLRNIGNTAAFRGRLIDEGRGLASTVTYQTPLEDDVPAFNPMSGETVGLGIEKRFQSRGFAQDPTFKLDYVRDLDFKQNGVMATFGFKF